MRAADALILTICVKMFRLKIRLPFRLAPAGAGFKGPFNAPWVKA